MAQEKPVVITVGEEEIDVNCSQASFEDTTPREDSEGRDIYTLLQEFQTALTQTSAEAGAEFNAAISIVEDEYH